MLSEGLEKLDTSRMCAASSTAALHMTAMVCPGWSLAAVRPLLLCCRADPGPKWHGMACEPFVVGETHTNGVNQVIKRIALGRIHIAPRMQRRLGGCYYSNY